MRARRAEACAQAIQVGKLLQGRCNDAFKRGEWQRVNVYVCVRACAYRRQSANSHKATLNL